MPQSTSVAHGQVLLRYPVRQYIMLGQNAIVVADCFCRPYADRHIVRTASKTDYQKFLFYFGFHAACCDIHVIVEFWKIMLVFDLLRRRSLI